MENTFHSISFSVVRLLDSDAISNRYLCIDLNGYYFEIRKLHWAWLQSVDLDRLVRRWKILRLSNAPATRRIMAFDVSSAEPSIRLSTPNADDLGTPLSQEPLQPPTPSQLHDMAMRLGQAILECHRNGLVLHDLRFEHVRISREGLLFVDFSGTELMDSASLYEACDDTSDGVEDPSIDVYAYGVMVDRMNRFQNEVVCQDLDEIAQQCMQREADLRPALRECIDRLLELQVSHASIATSTPAVSSSGFDATVHVEGPNESLDQGELMLSGVLLPKSKLGRYTIERKLGEGGMGAVYEAFDEADQRRVAVKILTKNTPQSTSLRKRFSKEARLLAKANNPYVANLLEFSEEAQFPYLVAEFVDGGTLGRQLELFERFSERTSLLFSSNIAHGLAIAHERGIIHRDIKPENMLLTKDGLDWLTQSRSAEDASAASSVPMEVLVKISDFGLARVTEQSESMAMTREGALLGTPLYMSPEQCRGEAADPRSDIYSLGAMMFHLLAGRPPFQAENQAALLNLHCNEPAPDLKQIVPSISDACSQIVGKCLAKNPDARYPNGRAILEELENILRGKPTSLGLHPPILALNHADALSFVHSWDLESSPSQLWPYVSNTDRVNHAIGLPSVKYTTRVDPIKGVERFAEASVAGQRIRWQEHPYEWIEGKRLSVLREFTHGPFSWFVNIVDLAPITGGGTRITQTLHVMPKGWIGRLIAKMQMGNKSKQSFGTAYAQIDRFLAENSQRRPDAEAFGKRFELSASRRSKLVERIRSLNSAKLDPLVTETLNQFVQHASDLEVARIRPIAFANRFGLDSNQVVQACLLGAKEGIFLLLWDILCPSCRIPSGVQETLSSIKDHGYCEACDIRFELDLSRSVELIFRVHPEIRDVETKTYCIGGPAWSKHVVAQVRIAAGERFACETELTEGTYTIRGPQLAFVAEFRVSPTGSQGSWEVPLSRPVDGMRTPVLKEHHQVIHFFNDTNQDLQVRVERTASKQDALTAAQASSLAIFRELFPDQVLSAGQMVSIAHITVMLIRFHGLGELYRDLGDGEGYIQFRKHLDDWSSAIASHQGAVVKLLGEGLQATFVDAASGMRAVLERLALPSGAITDSIILHSGPAMVATIDDRIDYFGKTMHQAERLLDASEAGKFYLTEPVLGSVSSDADKVLAKWQESLGEPAVFGGADDVPICQCFSSMPIRSAS